MYFRIFPISSFTLCLHQLLQLLLQPVSAYDVTSVSPTNQTEARYQNEVHSENEAGNSDSNPDLSLGKEEEEYMLYEYPAPLPDSKDASKKVICFTCHYAKTSQHEQGMKNCDEPFNKSGIPVVECNGSCAASRSTFDKKKKQKTKRRRGGGGISSGSSRGTNYDDDGEVGDNEDGYVVIRGCLAQCPEISEPDSSVRCCSMDWCNGGPVLVIVGRVIEAASLGAVGVVLIAGILWSVCYWRE